MTEKELKNFIKTHLNDDIDDLLLHASRYPDVDMRSVAVQLKGRRLATKKLPKWAGVEDLLYPEHLSLEQCSSQQTADYKASVVRRLSGSVLNPDTTRFDRPTGQYMTITDLTGGFGVDAVTLYKAFEYSRLVFVERNPDLCRLAEHNFPLLGVDNAETVCADCETMLPTLPHQHVIFIDPARRDMHGRKTVALADCTPDITKINDLLLEKADIVMVKLSPMLDITLASRQLKGLTEVHVVSVDGECKELQAVLRKEMPEGERSVTTYCVNLSKEGDEEVCFTAQEMTASSCVFADELMTYLYEPNASIMKANAMNALGARLNLEKLHPNSHLFTSRTFLNDFPGRRFEVMGVYPFNKQGQKELKAQVGKANLTVRNFPLSVAELRKRMKISEGGNDYIFATTLADNSLKLILCRKKV